MKKLGVFLANYVILIVFMVGVLVLSPLLMVLPIFVSDLRRNMSKHLLFSDEAIKESHARLGFEGYGGE